MYEQADAEARQCGYGEGQAVVECPENIQILSGVKNVLAGRPIWPKCDRTRTLTHCASPLLQVLVRNVLLF